uniref:Putative iron-sulfur cluster-binding domain contining protein n=1 Tax=viral metagenome TaxID=1070528 RepID=A0A6M3IJJ3_9ZZZZ
MNPWSISVELTQGCNRNCEWCGVSYASKGYNFMELYLAVFIAKQLNTWFPKGKRIEFALGGEPLLHPKYLDAIAIFRKFYSNSQLQLSTNGITLLKDFEFKVIELFSHGLNILVLSMYEPEGKILKDLVYSSNLKNIEVIDFHSSKETPWYNFGNKVKKLFLMGDISIQQGTKRNSRKLLNHAGNIVSQKFNIFPLAVPLQKKCTNVFRELVIRYDGTVTACCMDFSRKLVMGNAKNTLLKLIWNGVKFNAVRTLLYRERRDLLDPCMLCNYYGGFMQGIGLYDIHDDVTDEDVLIQLITDIGSFCRTRGYKLSTSIDGKGFTKDLYKYRISSSRGDLMYANTIPEILHLTKDLI